MQTWQELLGRQWEDVHDEYGPHSQAVVSAFDVLAQTRWFSRVGKRMRGSTATMVHSWQEALSIFEVDTGDYDISGHLNKPARLCDQVMNSSPYRDWWERAVSDSGDYYSYAAAIPASLNESWKDWLDNYLYQYVSYLLAEIVGADIVPSTYFREMLPWFREGHFPCGWVGNWPAGHIRTF
jgi:hypothetical protein